MGADVKMKKKRKKKNKGFLNGIKLSGFGKFLLTYSGILVGIVVILLVLLYGLLKDYEKSMPNNTIEVFAKDFTPDNISNILSENGIKVNEFETVDTVADYFKKIMQDETVTYSRKAGEFTNTSPVYMIKAGKTAIAKVTLVEKGKNAHKFTEWKVGSVSIDGYIDGDKNITITAPKGSTVYINGVQVNDSYITDRNVIPEAVRNVSAFVETPTANTYKVSGLLATPEITAKLNGKDLAVNVDKQKCTVSWPSDDALLEAQKANINSINEAYGKYIINRGSLSALTKNLVGTAKTQVSDIPAVWAFLYGMTYTYEFKNQSITNMVKYSDNCFSCNIYYDLYVKWNSGDKTYNTSMVYTFVKTGGNWYLADFSIN